jgi:transcriptional regulator with XRE-family HTH domain
MEENIIKQTCKELGINQKELAENSGISANTLSRWNKNPNEIPKYGIRMLELLVKEMEYNHILKAIKKHIK